MVTLPKTPLSPEAEVMLAAFVAVAGDDDLVEWVDFERHLSELRRRERALPVVWTEPRHELVSTGFVEHSGGQNRVTAAGRRYVEGGGRLGLALSAASKPAPRGRLSSLAFEAAR